MMDVHHKIGYHHMMSAHHFKSESESRLFKRPFSFLSSQRYNEVRSEPLHSCDENGECHLHNHLAAGDWHPAQDDQLQGVLEATWPLLDEQKWLQRIIQWNLFERISSIMCRTKYSEIA